MKIMPISFCGFRCDLCPANIKNIDKFMDRTTLRNGWKTFFNFDVTDDSIICVGCHNKGFHVDSECPVRPCCLEKKLENCSSCDLFDSCEKLRSRSDIVDEIRKKIKKTISK